MTVTIEKDSSTGEYRVPAKDGYENGAAYTDDKQDAIGICKKVYGNDVDIKFRTVREFVGGKYEKMRENTMNNFESTLQILKEGCNATDKKCASLKKKLTNLQSKLERMTTKFGEIDKKAKPEMYAKAKEQLAALKQEEKALEKEVKAAEKSCK